MCLPVPTTSRKTARNRCLKTLGVHTWRSLTEERAGDGDEHHGRKHCSHDPGLGLGRVAVVANALDIETVPVGHVDLLWCVCLLKISIEIESFNRQGDTIESSGLQC